MPADQSTSDDFPQVADLVKNLREESGLPVFPRAARNRLNTARAGCHESVLDVNQDQIDDWLDVVAALL